MRIAPHDGSLLGEVRNNKAALASEQKPLLKKAVCDKSQCRLGRHDLFAASGFDGCGDFRAAVFFVFREGAGYPEGHHEECDAGEEQTGSGSSPEAIGTVRSAGPFAAEGEEVSETKSRPVTNAVY